MFLSTCAQSWIRKKGLAGVVAAILLWMVPGVGLAQEEVVLTDGQREYHAYCATYMVRGLARELKGATKR